MSIGKMRLAAHPSVDLLVGVQTRPPGADAARAIRTASTDDRPRVLVSGAASGAGFACAEAFADQGAELILCDTDEIGLIRAADRLGAFSRSCDVGAEYSVEIFAEEVRSQFGRIDVLVNAAGRGYVRAHTMIRMSRAMMPLLREGSGYRLIANIASAGGFSARDAILPHAAWFASVTETLIEQCRGTQIEVACITPRLIRAEQGPALRSDQLYRLARIDEREAAERIVEMFAAERPNWRRRQPRAKRCA